MEVVASKLEIYGLVKSCFGEFSTPYHDGLLDGLRIGVLIVAGSLKVLDFTS